MSYIDPQSWTDVDSAGNPVDWTTRKNKLILPGYEMLRKALVERCAVTTTVVPAVLQNARTRNELYPDGWWTVFQSTMTTLIPKFVNITDNGGDWDNITITFFSEIGLDWTEATIIAAIGDASRLTAPTIPNADWALQQYKMLNMMRWTADRNVASGVADFRIVFANHVGADPPNWATLWATAVAAWPPAWNFFASTRGAGGWGRKNWDRIPRRVQLRRHRCKWLTYGVVGGAYAMTVDFYAFMTYGVHPPPQGVYDDEGLGNGYLKTWKFQTDGPSTDYLRYSDWLGNDDAVPPEPPNPTGSGEDRSQGWFNGGTTVNKWDVTDGLRFIA